MASRGLQRHLAMVSCRAFPRQTAFDPVLAYRFLRSSTISSTPLSTFSSRQSLPSNYTSIAQHHLFSTISRQYAVLMVKVPKMAESIPEGTLSSFSKQVGDHVEQDEEIASIETDKIDVSVNAPEAGVITRLMVSEGDTVTVGQDVVRIEPGAEGSVTAKNTSEVHNKLTSIDRPAPLEPELKKEEFKEEPEEETPPQPKQEEKPVLSKQEEKSIPPQQKKNTPLASKAMEGEPLKATGEEPPFGKGSRREARVKMNRMRLKIAERLKQSQNTAAFLTTFNEVDMFGIVEFRKRYKEEIFETHGVKLGFMSAFAKAATLALREIPAVNAAIEGPNGGDTIVYRDYVDISVAVSTHKGLVTPVLRNCESLNLIEMEQGIADLAKKARDGKLTIEDMAGGTFTISNGGVFGSMMGTPIINLPQTAVLGMHGIKERPVVVDGKIEIRPMMYLALTYDHRLIDGSESVIFLVAIQKYIQDPARMLLA